MPSSNLRLPRGARPRSEARSLIPPIYESGGCRAINRRALLCPTALRGYARRTTPLRSTKSSRRSSMRSPSDLDAARWRMVGGGVREKNRRHLTLQLSTVSGALSNEAGRSHTASSLAYHRRRDRGEERARLDALRTSRIRRPALRRQARYRGVLVLSRTGSRRHGAPRTRSNPASGDNTTFYRSADMSGHRVWGLAPLPYIPHRATSHK